MVVDVLSWSTAVAVAVGRGTAVVAHGWPPPPPGGDVACAVPRRSVDALHPWSLSPHDLLRSPHIGRLVLPSPNGSAIAAAITADVVVAACLRNATAVGRWLSEGRYGQPDRPVTVVAAGERWPDGSLRPCLEDLLGAGAVLDGLGPGAERTPEAGATEDAWRARRDRVGHALRWCESGVELADGGYAHDVALAAELDTQEVVPVLSGGAFVDAGPGAVVVRPATAADAGATQEVERAAGARFAAVGMPVIAGQPPMRTDRLLAYADAGRSWVATDAGGHVVGYVVADVVDGCGHVEQVSVHPSHQGHGVGRALLEVVATWAAGAGLGALTLTTFTDVPWNRPLYEHLGWVVLTPGQLTPGLVHLRAEEAADGLDPTLRVCMRRPVAPRRS